MDTETEKNKRKILDEIIQNKINEGECQHPKKFSSNFQRLVREKSKKTLTTTSNPFQPLTVESDSDGEDDIDKIVKRERSP